jgi:hypothetical protein
MHLFGASVAGRQQHPKWPFPYWGCCAEESRTPVSIMEEEASPAKPPSVWLSLVQATQAAIEKRDSDFKHLLSGTIGQLDEGDCCLLSKQSIHPSMQSWTRAGQATR